MFGVVPHASGSPRGSDAAREDGNNGTRQPSTTFDNASGGLIEERRGDPPFGAVSRIDNERRSVVMVQLGYREWAGLVGIEHAVVVGVSGEGRTLTGADPLETIEARVGA